MRGKERGAGGSKGEGGEGGGEAVLFRQFLNCSLARSRSFSLFRVRCSSWKRQNGEGKGKEEEEHIITLEDENFQLGKNIFRGAESGDGWRLWAVFCGWFIAQ